jgi:hypothetical protein
MPIARIRCKKTGPYEVSRSPNEISRRVVPRERLGDLARDPIRGWVCRHADTQSRLIDRNIQCLERDVGIANEAFAIFVRFWLTSTPSLPVGLLRCCRQTLIFGG